VGVLPKTTPITSFCATHTDCGCPAWHEVARGWHEVGTVGTWWHGWHVPEPSAKGVVNWCHCSQGNGDQRVDTDPAPKIPEERLYCLRLPQVAGDRLSKDSTQSPGCLTDCSGGCVSKIGAMTARQSPETRDSLLVRIKDAADRDAWNDFAAVYRPLVYRVARSRGMQDADAQDLSQQVLLSVAAKIDEWELGQEQGSFRKWLSRIARNAAIDHFRRVRPDVALGGSSVLQTLRDQADGMSIDDETLAHEYQREVFRLVARRVRSEFHEATWTAFWMTTVDGNSIEAAADKTGKTIGAVYTARSRVMQRLREAVQEYHEDIHINRHEEK